MCDDPIAYDQQLIRRIKSTIIEELVTSSTPSYQAIVGCIKREIFKDMAEQRFCICVNYKRLSKMK